MDSLNEISKVIKKLIFNIYLLFIFIDIRLNVLKFTKFKQLRVPKRIRKAPKLIQSRPKQIQILL